MKALLFITSAFFTFNVFAGEIVNTSTGESIRFDVNQEERVIEITSNTAGVPASLKLDAIKDSGRYVKANYFSVTQNWVEDGPYDGSYAMAYFPLLAPMFVVTIGSNVIDILLAPGQALTVAVKNAAYRKDFRTLLKAINTTETFRVNDNRFRRIAKLLK